VREATDRRGGLQHRPLIPTCQPDRTDRGASAIELAIVAPTLLLLIFFSIQAGLFYYGRVVAQQAAREGVSVLRLAQNERIADGVRAQIQDNVEGYSRAVGRETLLDPTATSTYDDLDGTVSVTVTGQVISLVPGLDLTVRQRVDGTVERFDRDDRPR